ASTVRRLRDRAAAVDRELDRHAALQGRVVAQPVLVAEAKAAEVLADDALDDLGRESAVDGGGAFADAGGLYGVPAAQPSVTAARPLPRAVAGALTKAAEGAEADPFPSTSATCARAEQAQASGSEGVVGRAAETVGDRRRGGTTSRRQRSRCSRARRLRHPRN